MSRSETPQWWISLTMPSLSAKTQRIWGDEKYEAEARPSNWEPAPFNLEVNQVLNSLPAGRLQRLYEFDSPLLSLRRFNLNRRSPSRHDRRVHLLRAHLDYVWASWRQADRSRAYDDLSGRALLHPRWVSHIFYDLGFIQVHPAIGRPVEIDKTCCSRIPLFARGSTRLAEGSRLRSRLA